MVAASTILSNNVITVSAFESLASHSFIAGDMQALAGTQRNNRGRSTCRSVAFWTTFRRDWVRDIHCVRAYVVCLSFVAAAHLMYSILNNKITLFCISP